MRRRYFRMGGFEFGFPPFGFFFHGPGRFPRREDYLRMLKEELKEVERELNALKGPTPEPARPAGAKPQAVEPISSPRRESGTP